MTHARFSSKEFIARYPPFCVNTVRLPPGAVLARVQLMWNILEAFIKGSAG